MAPAQAAVPAWPGGGNWGPSAESESAEFEAAQRGNSHIPPALLLVARPPGPLRWAAGVLPGLGTITAT